MFEEFPREVGPPRKLVKSKKEYLEYVNLYNGKKRAIYTSIYMFKDFETINYKPYIKSIYKTAVIDKIYFDFDFKSCYAYKECMKLHKECMKENLKHTIIFSGRGYHLYIFTKPKTLTHKKESIKGAQEYFVNKLNLTVDKQVIGNIAQLARIPNTFHIKANRFCIPLSKEQFEEGSQPVKLLSYKQNFIKNYIIKGNLLDISKWDVESEDIIIDLPTPKILFNPNTNTNMKDVPLCILRLLDKKNAKWKERYLLILYFKEKGFLKEEVFQILKNHLSPAKLKHCIKDERQLQYLFGRNDLLFPSCKNIKNDGFCPKKCDLYEKVVYK